MIEYRTALGGAEASDSAVSGLVTPFGVETTIGNPKNGGFREEIAPGAFKKTLQERDIVFLFNHNTDMPLARTSVPEGEGSLSLREAGDGLRADATPVDTSYGSDLMKLTRAKVVKGMSFGFEVVKDSWTDDEGRASDATFGTKRTIHEVRLHEVSAVTFPAYTTTEFSARDAINAARGAEERAPKATYADVETCGECGATGQYGQFCSGCGGSMSQSYGPSGDFCTSCGSALDSSSRAAHECYDIRADKPYGDVEYADPKNGKYPIDTKAHAKAAWGYINVQKNADEYPINGVTLASVKAKIKAACKKFGVEISDEKSADEIAETRTVSAEIDACLDEAFNGIATVDRNALPPEVNQFIDLASAALKLASADLKETGTPDPDHDNGNSYSDADESDAARNTEPAGTTPEYTPEELREIYRSFYGV